MNRPSQHPRKPRSPRKPRKPRTSAGFSLIELLVMIAIISLLLGLLLVGVAQMREGAETSQTRAILAGLTGVATDYEVATQTPIAHVTTGVFNWNANKQYNAPGSSGQDQIDWPPSATDEQIANALSERFVWAVQKRPESATAVARVGEGRLVDEDDDGAGDGFLEIRDAWGNSIAYATYNRPGDPDYFDFLPTRNESFFATPGPDGRWGEPRFRSDFNSDGDWENYLASSEYEQSRDNLYSFDIDQTSGVLGN